jgi:predicted peroxiredoxin
MPEKKRILYVQTSGIDTPERTYAPLVLATTAASLAVVLVLVVLMALLLVSVLGGP